MSSERFEVELTETAERVYRKLFEDAQECLNLGDESNSKVKLFNMVDEAVTKIIPHDPLNPGRALSGHLSNIFRVKKGRIRICYVASSKHRKIVILYISERPRKARDVHDPYEIFMQMVLSGAFEETFARLGIRLPNRKFSAIATRYPINPQASLRERPDLGVHSGLPPRCAERLCVSGAAPRP